MTTCRAGPRCGVMTDAEARCRALEARGERRCRRIAARPERLASHRPCARRIRSRSSSRTAHTSQDCTWLLPSVDTLGGIGNNTPEGIQGAMSARSRLADGVMLGAGVSGDRRPGPTPASRPAGWRGEISGRRVGRGSSFAARPRALGSGRPWERHASPGRRAGHIRPNSSCRTSCRSPDGTWALLVGSCPSGPFDLIIPPGV